MKTKHEEHYNMTQYIIKVHYNCKTEHHTYESNYVHIIDFVMVK